MMRLVLVFLLALTSLADARPRGIKVSESSSFNGGKFQTNISNGGGISGDFPLINYIKDSSGGWSQITGSGFVAPDEFDTYAYPTSSSPSILNFGGVTKVIRIPAQAYIGGNCLAGTNGTGTCFVFRVNGKGTISNPTTIINTSTSTATVTTGATTRITFLQAQDFRAGMEVPISGTTGVTMTNYVGGTFTAPTGTTTAWTVCASGLTTTTIELCLNDQTTKLQTSGTAAGTTVVTYGRNNVGVAAGGRIVGRLTSSAVSINVGISAQDASTPITYRNGIDGLALITQGSEEVRYEAGEIFGAKHLAKIREAMPGVIRNLNLVNENYGADVIWADRTRVGQVSWSGPQYNRLNENGTLRNIYAGVTTSTLTNYALTHGTGGPTDGQQISYVSDYSDVTLTGGSQLVSWPSHGLYNGSPIVFGIKTGGVAPTGITLPAVGGNATPAGGAPAGFTYFAITTCGSCDANTIQYATTTANALAGIAATAPSTSGTNVIAHASTTSVAVSLTSGSPTIAWPNHLLNVGDMVAFGDTNLSYPLNTVKAYYVVSTGSGTITISETSGGAAITPLNNGSFQATKVPTLSLNGTTPVAIMGAFGTGVGTVKSEQMIPRLGANNPAYGYLTYDATLNIWIKKGGDSSYGPGYLLSGWPPEIFLRFCRELGAHPWVIPSVFTVSNATTRTTDYNPSLYSYYRNNAPSWMVPIFEITNNELWNNLFPATWILRGHGVVYARNNGWTQGSGVHQIAGLGASILGQAVHNVYGGTIDGTRYQTTIGLQTFNFTSANGPTTNAPRVTASDYVANGPVFGSYSQTPASDWTTHVSPATYVSLGYHNSAYGAVLAAKLNGGVMNGSISGNQLTATVRNVAAGRAFPSIGIGTVLSPGPGVIPGTTLTSNSGACGVNCYTLDRTYANPVGSTNINYTVATSDLTAAQTFIDSWDTTASFTGSTSGTNVLTASGVTGFIGLGGGSGGDFLMGTGVPGFIQISSQLTSTLPATTFTASAVNISGTVTTMTVTAMLTGTTISPGDFLTGANVDPNQYVVEQLTGTGGATCPDVTCDGTIGTYGLFDADSFASTTVTSAAGGKDGTYQLTTTPATITSRAMTTAGVFSNPSINLAYLAVDAFADARTNRDGFVLRKNAYEGAYSPDYTQIGLAKTDQLAFQGKFVTSTPNMATGAYGYSLQNCNNFKAVGGEYCSLYMMFGLSPSNQAWSIIEDIYWPGAAPIWDAYKDYNFLLKRDLHPASNDNDPMWLEKAA